MLSADIVTGSPVRPDRVYGTGVLTAIPGFQPVQNAMEVAQRFTAIFPPRVTDVPVSAGSGGVPSSMTATSTTPPLSGASRPNLLMRFRIWNGQRKLGKALRKMGVNGLGAAGRGPAPSPYSLPVVGGWAPAPTNAMQMGLRLSASAAGSRTASPFPPVFQPQMATAMALTPGANTAQRLASQYRQPGSVGARAEANAMHDFYTTRTDMPWGR